MATPDPCPPSSTTRPKMHWVDLGVKLISLLVLPLLGLGVSMYTEASVTRERVTQLQHDTQRNRTQLESVDSRINQIALTVQETNGRILELRTVLDIIRAQVVPQHPTTRSGAR